MAFSINNMIIEIIFILKGIILNSRLLNIIFNNKVEPNKLTINEVINERR